MTILASMLVPSVSAPHIKAQAGIPPPEKRQHDIAGVWHSGHFWRQSQSRRGIQQGNSATSVERTHDVGVGAIIPNLDPTTLFHLPLTMGAGVVTTVVAALAPLTRFFNVYALTAAIIGSSAVATTSRTYVRNLLASTVVAFEVKIISLLRISKFDARK